MNKKNSIKAGIITNLLITLAIGMTSFIVNKYFIKYLGTRELGLMKLFTQMIAYLNLVELGLGTASAYSLYKPLNENNIEKINVIISTIEDLYNKIFLCILILGLLVSPTISFFIKENIERFQDIYLYWILYVLNTALSYKLAKYNILFTANQEFKFVRIVQGGSKIIIQLLQILVLILYKSFLVYIALLIFENIIQYVFYRVHFRKKYLYIKKVKEREHKIVKDLLNLFWHKVASIIVFNTDFIIISKFISLTMVGIYSNYIMIINIISSLIGIVTNVLTPKIGNYISNHSTEQTFKLWKKININFIFISVVLTYVTYKLINQFILLWLKGDYLLSPVTVILIMINLFLLNTRVITEIFKNGYGFFSDIYLPIAEALINLVLSITLVNFFQIDGVIFGTVISNIVIILLAKPMLVFKNCFKKEPEKYLKILIEYLFLGTLTILLSEIIINSFFEIRINLTWISWILQAISITLISLSIGVLIFSFNEDFRENLKNIKKIFEI